MSLCNECTATAKRNREEWDSEGPDSAYIGWTHPQNCGCPCQHRDPEQWSKQFSTEQPNG